MFSSSTHSLPVNGWQQLLLSILLYNIKFTAICLLHTGFESFLVPLLFNPSPLNTDRLIKLTQCILTQCVGNSSQVSCNVVSKNRTFTTSNMAICPINHNTGLIWLKAGGIQTHSRPYLLLWYLCSSNDCTSFKSIIDSSSTQKCIEKLCNSSFRPVPHNDLWHVFQ